MLVTDRHSDATMFGVERQCIDTPFAGRFEPIQRLPHVASIADGAVITLADSSTTGWEL